MNRNRTLWIVAFVACVLPRPARAQTVRTDSSDVIATVQKFFDAMEKRDTAALRSVLLPGTRFVVLLADTVPGTARTQVDSVFIRSIGGAKQALLERMWTPVVHVQGPIATLWTPYDFHVDGTRSHCGVDAFTLAQTATGWQITSIAYTVQRRSCPVSPLGPPR
jgi:hypothetical protein